MEIISPTLLTFLVNALWQVPVAAAVAVLSCRLMRNGPAAHRHAVWVMALAAAILAPALSLRTIDLGPVPELTPALPTAMGAPHMAASAVPAVSAPVAPRTISLAERTAFILIAVYALFLLFRVARLALAWRRTRQVRAGAHGAAFPEPVRRVWTRCQEAFGIDDVELLFSPSISGPVAAGRAIILPESLRESTAEDVLTTAIGHEMAHIARHDFGFNLLYELLLLPLSFHPAAWLIRSGIERTREMACDELVTRRLIEPGAYAQSIVSIARGMLALPGPGYTLGVFDGDILEERIRRLLERPAADLRRARLLLAGGLSAVAVCGVAASMLALTARAQSATDSMKLAEAALNRRDFTEAHKQARKAADADPTNKVALYMVGFSDWSLSYPDYAAAHVAAGMQPQDPGIIPDPAARLKLRVAHMSQIAEGLDVLQRAIDLDADFSDAMAYMNLLYRIEAGIVESSAESAELIAKADHWVGEALDAKQRRPPANGNFVAAPPPPPPPPPPGQFQKLQALLQASAPGVILVEGKAQQAKLVNAPPPIYPQSARDAGIAGTVRVSVLIGKDGKVERIMALSGAPALVGAAMEAVRQWVYQPTTLNGEPVEVITTVDVNFAIGQ
jgi:TonB family protein